MSNETKSVKDIFLATVEKPSPADRAAFLDEACAGDAALRGRVEALLKAHDEPGSFLEKPAVELAHEPDPGAMPEEAGQAAGPPMFESGSTGPYDPPPERPGTVIGPYKLLQLLGEGGMGTVYLAQQDEPVKRQVALKIIKAGMDSGQVLARFEQERQALAVLDHPNIAKVLDAGTTGSEPRTSVSGSAVPLTNVRGSEMRSAGRPFFVMELVKGIPVTNTATKSTFPRKSDWNCSSLFATQCSTRIRRGLSTAI
jgi:serine/threonine-protein kinase